MITLEEHIKSEIKRLEKEIKKGREPNKNNLDGYTLKGLGDRLKVLKECLFKLTNKD